MRPTLCRVLLLMLMLIWAAPVWADGTTYNGNCSTIAWNANTEIDLLGYRLYDRVTVTALPTLIKTLGSQITSVTCASLGFNEGQHYLTLTAFNSWGESPHSSDLAFVIVRNNQIADFRVTVVNATDVTLAWTEVDDGTGAPATYDVRVAAGQINWGSAVSVTSGTCSSAVAGTTIGATKTCTVTGLSTTTAYQFQAVPYRGTLGSGAVFGPLSNIVDATTGGGVPSTGRLTLVSDGFNYADGSIPSPWQGGYIFGLPVREWTIVSGAARATTAGTEHLDTYSTTTLPNDSWVEITLKTLTGAGVYGPRILLAFAAPPTWSGYEIKLVRGLAYEKTRVAKYVDGDFTQLSTENATTWAAADVARVERHGDEITVYRNGSIISALTVSDSTFRDGGLGGMMMYIDSGGTPENAEIEFFSMGTFGTASTDTCDCDQH